MDRSRVQQGELFSQRLRLRPWVVADAAFHRRLWAERDPRVPARRRLTADGRPTLAEMEDWLRAYRQEPAPGLLVVERADDRTAIGYCGLVANSVGRPEEPELAYEFLQASWGRGYATEASRVVIGLAAAVGYEHLASTVREWNAASFAVLRKLGFVDTGYREREAVHGDSVLLRLQLRGEREGHLDATEPGDEPPT